MSSPDASWTALKPLLKARLSQDALIALARVLSRISKEEDPEQALDDARVTFNATAHESKRSDRQAMLATGLLMTDLAAQGWLIRARAGRVEIAPPTPLSGD